jgi:hypothetical protein
MLRPHDATPHVERHDLTGAEPGENVLAVGDGRRSCQVVLFVEPGERAARVEAVFPEATAVGSIERFDDEEDRVDGAGWFVAPAAYGFFAGDQCGVIARQRRMRAAGERQPTDLRRHKDLIAPDDRR